MKRGSLKPLEVILVLLCLIASAASITVSQGTEIYLTDVNATVKLGSSQHFDNLTVYDSKVRFGTVNVSVYAENNESIIFNLTRFEPESEQSVSGDIIYMGESETDLNVKFENLPEPENSFNLSLGNRSKEFSGGEIDYSFKFSENSSLTISETTETNSGSNTGNTGDSGGSPSGGSSDKPSGGSTAGNGGGLGGALDGTDRDNQTQGEEESPETAFERSSIRLNMKEEENRTVELRLLNTGNQTSTGLLETWSLPVKNPKKEVTVEALSNTSVDTIFEPADPGNWSGKIIYNYSSGEASIRINLTVEEKKTEVRTNLSKDEEGLRYSVDISGASGDDKLRTTIYSENGEILYTENLSLEPRTDEITRRVKKNLKPGNYRVVSQIISGNGTSSNITEEIVIREEGNPIRKFTLLLSLAVLVISILGTGFIIKRRKEKIRKGRDRGVEDTKERILQHEDRIKEEEPINSSKDLNEDFRGEKEEQNMENETEDLEEYEEKAERIYEKMEGVELPEKVKDKQEKIKRDLEEGRTEKLGRDLDELEQMVDRNRSEG